MFVKFSRILTILFSLLVFSQAVHSSENLSGEWEGMFHCFGVNFFFDLEIEVEGENNISAKLEAEPILMGRRGINWRPEFVSTNLHGEYIPELSIFRLNSSNVPNNQWFDFVGVVEPNTKQMSAHVKSRFYGSCSYLVGARNVPNDIIRPVVNNAKYTPARTNSNGLGPRQCDADIQNWLKQLDTFPEELSREKIKYAALTLFQDEYFRPIFGSTFERMSRSRLAKMSYQIQAGCPQAIQSQKARSVLPQIGVVLENNAGLSRAEVFMHPETIRIIGDWSLWAMRTIHEQARLNDVQFDFFTEAANEASQILWPTGSVDFQTEVEIAKQRNRTNQFLVEVRHQIESGFESIQQFSRLSTTAANNAKEGISSEGIQQAHELIGQAINENMVNITKIFVANQTTLSELNNLQLVEGNPAFSQFVNYLSTESKQQANLLLSTQRRKLIKSFAENEINSFSENNYDVDGELLVLEDLVNYENDLDLKYGELLKEIEFAEFNAVRSDYREKLFNKHRDHIISLIESSDNFDQMNAIVGKYSSEKDSSTYSMLQSIAVSHLNELRSQYIDYCTSQEDLARSIMELRLNGNPKSSAMTLVQGLGNMSINVVDFVYGIDFDPLDIESVAGRDSLEEAAATTVKVRCLRSSPLFESGSLP